MASKDYTVTETYETGKLNVGNDLSMIRLFPLQRLLKISFVEGDPVNKPLNDISSSQQPLVKLPGLTTSPVNPPYQTQQPTGAIPPPNFAYGTLHRSPNLMGRHMFSTPMNQSTPLASHRVMTTMESSWKCDTQKRDSAGMI